MNTKLAIVLASMLAVVAPAQAHNSHGCLKGAAVGGVAGHFARHHALVGAAVGCGVGHYMAKHHHRHYR